MGLLSRGSLSNSLNKNNVAKYAEGNPTPRTYIPPDSDDYSLY
jgi:hypothetical protein